MPATLNNTGVLFNDSSQQSTAFIGYNASIFTSSSTFTVPAGVTKLKITAIGGGGGGGGYTGQQPIPNYGGSGGGCIAIVTVTGGTTYTVTVGAGGAGKNWSIPQQDGTGSNGGETWFGVNSGSKLVSCGGGQGAQSYSTCVSINANGTTGTVSVTGTILRQQSSTNWGGTTGETLSSVLFGGQTYWATSSNQAAQTWDTNSAYAAGCGGRGQTSNGSNTASGGFSGFMIIEY